MSADLYRIPINSLPAFDRHFFDGTETFTRIGSGEIGGKAQGLALLRELLSQHADALADDQIEVSVPRLAVLSTDCFDDFMQANRLYDIALSDARDDEIALAFQKGNLSPTLVGDLGALTHHIHTPLAVRSSSLMEDAMFEPFAGVYETKMIPNNQFDSDTRFRKLIEAIRFVYASTFFRAAKSYVKAIGKSIESEKMAVIIQEVVGLRHGDRFYPNISGVARSYNYYPTGHAKPLNGVVNLALGLGKTIVDGGISYAYSPAFPKAKPPYRTFDELLDQSQTQFWAVNMGKPPEYDPIHETEYLVQAGIQEAEQDETLAGVASTYVAAEERLVNGVGAAGPRLLNFGPILQYDLIPLNSLVKQLLRLCEERIGNPVEIEFAVTLEPERPSHGRFGFLQVRPMVVSTTVVEVLPDQLTATNVVIATERSMGNGNYDNISDIVFVKPERFEAAHTPAIAQEIDALNRRLTEAGRPYLLVGFGRWGSSEPWLGIPVEWGNISGAKLIVEATLPTMDVELSQGSHFFHNLSSFHVLYFSVAHAGKYAINWQWMHQQHTESELKFVKHVKTDRPLIIKADGRTGLGVVLHG